MILVQEGKLKNEIIGYNFCQQTKFCQYELQSRMDHIVDATRLFVTKNVLFI